VGLGAYGTTFFIVVEVVSVAFPGSLFPIDSCIVKPSLGTDLLEIPSVLILKLKEKLTALFFYCSGFQTFISVPLTQPSMI
jgi:hypothetical protein